MSVYKQIGLIFISIHALREEGDPRPRHTPARPHISIHALREEGDGCDVSAGLSGSHFYPRPPRGGRLWEPYPSENSGLISIHALREEGDGIRLAYDKHMDQFLSTPSARRATAAASGALVGVVFLSTPSARRATPRR